MSALATGGRDAATIQVGDRKNSSESDREFERFCGGIRRLCGIDLAQYKREQMERRIRSFIDAGGRGRSLSDYLEVVRRDKSELDRFLDRVTINVSQLWRNPELWDLLSKEVLPDLSKRGATVRAWSAGCSYGAEAHSLSAVAHDAKVPIRILGTDIDTRMVDKARAGLFSKADGRDAPRAALARHFDADPKTGELQAKDHVRRPLRFEQGDLLRIDPRPESYDLVLCRNTVIYFTPDVTAALHARLAKALRPGGRLVIGNTERVADPAAHGLESESPFCLRKV